MNIGIRYAKALFQIAKEQNNIELYMNELKEIETFFLHEKKLEEFFYDPLVGKAKKLEIISIITDKLQLSKEIKNLLILLINGGREKILPDIITSYEQMYDNYKGIIKVDIYTAYDITQEEINNLKKQIKSIFNKEPALKINKDTTIIGGLKLKVGWTIYDGTIKTRLKDFAYSVKL
ncbi:MAG: ATP synthase F1 subunit delta [bacterium]